jgi:hypothetical protein
MILVENQIQISKSSKIFVYVRNILYLCKRSGDKQRGPTEIRNTRKNRRQKCAQKVTHVYDVSN